MGERITLNADASQINDFLKCQRLWFYKYIRNIEFSLPGDKKAIAMDKGTLVHVLMDNYYRKISENPTLNTIEIAQDCVNKFRTGLTINKEITVSKEDQNLIATRFLMYSQQYLKGDFKPLVIDGVPQSEVGFSIPLLDNDKYYYVLEGKIDLIAKYGNSEFFIDHKTQSRRYDLYKFRPQFLVYSLATGCTQGCINYFSLADKADQNTFRRQTFIVSKDMQKRWKEKLISIFHRMAGCKINETYEMNESACEDKFGLCSYAQLDEELNDEIREKLIKIQYREREEWKPWKLNGDK